MRTFSTKQIHASGASLFQVIVVALGLLSTIAFLVAINEPSPAARPLRDRPTLHSFYGETDAFTSATFRGFSGTVSVRGGFALADCELKDGRRVLALPLGDRAPKLGDQVELWRFSWSPEPGSVLTSLVALPSGGALWPPKG